MKMKFALIAAAVTLALPVGAQAQMRALSDPVEGHPNPESLFTSDDPVLHRNKQAALRIQRELLKCNLWTRAGEWLTDRYIQHNPMAASGLKGVQGFFIPRARPLDPCGGAGGRVAGSQCSSALPSTKRQVSNQVVV